MAPTADHTSYRAASGSAWASPPRSLPAPRLIVADEPVSALDVSVQAQVLNLLSALQQELGIAILLITHDLAVVRAHLRPVAVMYLGRMVELRRAAGVQGPAPPYTQALMAAIPVPDPARRLPARSPASPSPIEPPTGCPSTPAAPSLSTLRRDVRR